MRRILNYESNEPGAAFHNGWRRTLHLLGAILHLAWFGGLAVGWWLYLNDEMGSETARFLAAATLYSLANALLIGGLAASRVK